MPGFQALSTKGIGAFGADNEAIGWWVKMSGSVQVVRMSCRIGIWRVLIQFRLRIRLGVFFEVAGIEFSILL